MVYIEDVRVTATFMAFVLVSWLVFARFAGLAQFGYVMLIIFSCVWVASISVAFLPVISPVMLTFATVSKKLQKKGYKKHTSNAIFLTGHISVWIAASLAFCAAMVFLGFMPFSSFAYISVGYASIIAGVYKLLSHDHKNIATVLSPEFFFSKNWRHGYSGAYKMGAHHAYHVFSSNYVSVIALLVTGYVNMLLMGVLSIALMTEKISSRPVFVSRVSGLFFIVLGLCVIFFGK